ncbi:DgyrCDS3314 [Dimorphilus gyrociliatus]|uniref:DgyrCDS3314 n=1 Tax=Dimorphilus gyrociliatus TaxID=2664684 RepID=A0A7I8VCU8_9ANNE|nr:DgyrCDS3314 [Dimorphilus gyrociliatus]
MNTRSRMIKMECESSFEDLGLSNNKYDSQIIALINYLQKKKCFEFKEIPILRTNGKAKPLDQLLMIILQSKEIWKHVTQFSTGSLLFELFLSFYKEVVRANPNCLKFGSIFDHQSRTFFLLKESKFIEEMVELKQSITSILESENLAKRLTNCDDFVIVLNKLLGDACDPVTYFTQTDCVRCGSYRKHHECKENMDSVSISGVVKNLDMCLPVYYDNCTKCNYSDTPHYIVWHEIPQFLMVSFKVPYSFESHMRLDEVEKSLNFEFNSKSYVLHSITYKRDREVVGSWIKSFDSGLWLETKRFRYSGKLSKCNNEKISLKNIKPACSKHERKNQKILEKKKFTAIYTEEIYNFLRLRESKKADLEEIYNHLKTAISRGRLRKRTALSVMLESNKFWKLETGYWTIKTEFLQRFSSTFRTSDVKIEKSEEPVDCDRKNWALEGESDQDEATHVNDLEEQGHFEKYVEIILKSILRNENRFTTTREIFCNLNSYYGNVPPYGCRPLVLQILKKSKCFVCKKFGHWNLTKSSYRAVKSGIFDLRTLEILLNS